MATTIFPIGNLEWRKALRFSAYCTAGQRKSDSNGLVKGFGLARKSNRAERSLALNSSPIRSAAVVALARATKRNSAHGPESSSFGDVKGGGAAIVRRATD